MRLPSIGTLLGVVSTITLSLATQLPYRVLYEFSLGTWIENLYVRPNGDILVTSLIPNASVYLVSNPTSSSPDVTLVHTFSGIDGVLGIVETLPDVFVTFGGNFSDPGVADNGTFSVFEIDFRQKSSPTTKLVTTMPRADFLNGVQAVPDEPTTILISDSTLGLVWRLDTLTGKYEVGIQVPEMAVVSGAPFPIGINGIHIHNGYLYWTNSFATTIYRLCIDGLGYVIPGAQVETVVQLNIIFLDDLTTGPLDGDTVWVATNLGDTIVAVQPDGSSVVVDGSESQLAFAGTTSCAFGKTEKDYKTLYVTTDGGLAHPVNGTLTEGGAVIAVDTSSFSEYH